MKISRAGYADNYYNNYQQQEWSPNDWGYDSDDPIYQYPEYELPEREKKNLIEKGVDLYKAWTDDPEKEIWA